MFVGRLWDRGLLPVFSHPVASGIGVAVALYGLFVVIRKRDDWPLRAVALWMALHVIAYTTLRVFWAHHWYYYPLFVGTVAFFAVGAVEAFDRTCTVIDPSRRRRRLCTAAGIVLVGSGLSLNMVRFFEFRRSIPTTFYVGGRDTLYRLTASWLRDHTPPSATVAVIEPGTLAYYADRTMIDMMGLVTPGVGTQMKHEGARRVTVPWTIATFEPDLFALTWPTTRPITRTLDPEGHYVLEDVIAAQGVDHVVLLYTHQP
jgi:hypothetical protein